MLLGWEKSASTPGWSRWPRRSFPAIGSGGSVGFSAEEAQLIETIRVRSHTKSCEHARPRHERSASNKVRQHAVRCLLRTGRSRRA